jgi:hypothetical protein
MSYENQNIKCKILHYNRSNKMLNPGRTSPKKDRSIDHYPLWSPDSFSLLFSVQKYEFKLFFLSA